MARGHQLAYSRQERFVDEVGALCEWMATRLGLDVPLHLTAFHPDWKMRMFHRLRLPLSNGPVRSR